MIFGPSGHVHGPRNQLVLTLELPNYFKKTINNISFSENIILGHLKILEIENVESCGKDARQTNLQDPFKKFLKIFPYGINIFQKT